ncbi:MAG: DUF3124 domain-containing protein [Betaproteobacteria bacterium]|nr:MAG: DUF3124 domain-containing protein [Betaproteobacteria bacterium]
MSSLLHSARALPLLSLLVLSSGLAFGQVPPGRSLGQNLYLPIYSHIWHGELDKKGQPMKTLVSVSVSIRNTDPVKSIRILSAQYYDSDGRKVKEYVTSPKTIGPMATYELFVPRSDDSGGSGANFVITWKSDTPTIPPIVEGFHANLPVGRSIAFTTSARPLPGE